MVVSQKALSYAAWLAVCFFWGTTYLAIRIGLETMPPMLFAGLRFLCAGTILLVIMRARGARLPHGKEWLNLTLIGMMLLGVGTGVVVWTEQRMPSGLVALLVALAPFWFTGVEWLLERSARVSRLAVIGMVVGFLGLVLLVGPQIVGVPGGHFFLFGAIALQFGCASWSAGSVISKYRRTGVRPLMSAAVQMLIAGLALTLVGTALQEWPRVAFSHRSLAAFIYLIVFGSLVAYSAYTYVIDKLPLPLISMYSYINPVIAVLLGALILSEPIGIRVVVSTIVILSGVALVRSGNMRSKPAVVDVNTAEVSDAERAAIHVSSGAPAA